jgi:hypothetical protein
LEGAPIVDRHDRIFLKEGHRVAFARVFLEFPIPGGGLRGHKILHHVVVLELMLHEVCVIRTGLLKESLEMVCRPPCLALATTRSGRDGPIPELSAFLSLS